MTTSFKWSARSLRELKGIHPDLRKVCDLALKLSHIDFLIVDGLRTVEEQREYVRKGASKTMKSNHLKGHAVDFAVIINGKVSWHSGSMKEVAQCFKRAAAELGIKIKWGGDWRTFKDYPHIELDQSVYGRG